MFLVLFCYLQKARLCSMSASVYQVPQGILHRKMNTHSVMLRMLSRNPDQALYFIHVSIETSKCAKKIKCQSIGMIEVIEVTTKCILITGKA